MDNFSIQLNNVSKSFKLDNKKGLTKLLKSSTNSKQQKSILALDNISFTVSKGEVLSIIGLNGSGKSTLLRIIAGVYKPNSGYVKINGSLSPLMQLGTGFQLDLVARDNIIMNGMLLGLPKSSIMEKVKGIIEFAELEKFSQMKLKHYSSGMRVRFAFSTALETNPDIILMDEALAVGDKPFREKSFEAFQSFREKGKTMIFSTHSLGQYSKFCDQALLLQQGKILMISGPDEVMEKYDQITKKKPNKPKKNKETS